MPLKNNTGQPPQQETAVVKPYLVVSVGTAGELEDALNSGYANGYTLLGYIHVFHDQFFMTYCCVLAHYSIPVKIERAHRWLNESLQSGVKVDG